jgi:hypothetical protein
MSWREPGRRLRTLAVAIVALGLIVGFAACGGSGIQGGGTTEAETIELEGKPSGNLTISNGPLYIDYGTFPAF